MMCYKDMSFCSARCRNMQCPRQYTEAQKAGARKWWGDRPNGPPVAFMDFSEGCEEYQPKEEEADKCKE